MQKYLKIFKNSFATALEYRANFFGSLLVELFGVLSFLVLWISIYKDNETVGGYNFSEAILYYILIPLIGFITTCSVSDVLGDIVKSGFLSNLLIKPYKIWIASFSESLANKLSTLIITSPIYIGISIYIIFFLESNPITLTALSVGICIAIFAYLLHFFMDLFIAWSAFWVDDVWAFYHAKGIIFAVLGGLSFPFEFLPETMKILFNVLPFKFMYYVPVSYILGKRDISQNLLFDVLSILVWGIVFAGLAFILWKKGIQKYGAFGG